MRQALRAHTEKAREGTWPQADTPLACTLARRAAGRRLTVSIYVSTSAADHAFRRKSTGRSAHRTVKCAHDLRLALMLGSVCRDVCADASVVCMCQRRRSGGLLAPSAGVSGMTCGCREAGTASTPLLGTVTRGVHSYQGPCTGE